MATVGKALTVPESGWKRIESSDSNIQYIGQWNTHTSENYSGGSSSSSSSIGGAISFNFIGSKIRLIAFAYTGYSSNIDISIDGVIQNFSLSNYVAGTTGGLQTLVYEKVGLPKGEHIVTIVNKETTLKSMNLDAIDIDSDGSILPYKVQLRQQLLVAERGWKRYDDKNAAIKYEGIWSVSNLDSRYQGSAIYNQTTDGKITFKFIGSKLRVITEVGSSAPTEMKIKIDGVEETFSCYSPNFTQQTLVYEKVGLDSSIHEVSMYKESGKFFLDALDIDSNGRLLHSDEVLALNELQVGKRIRCKYTALNGQFGSFSKFGEETYIDGNNDFIPPLSSATPNGDFYFIMVEDWNGKKRLVADRNIQHSISWDTLNTSGIASGGGLPLTSISDEPTIENGFYRNLYAVRLLTGGTTSADKDNEWDNYIVNSNLEGTIKAGDNAVWNWSGINSWTSTTGTTTTDRMVRGNSSVDGRVSVTSSMVANHRGFRPILEEYANEFVIFDKTLILHDGEYKKWNQGSPASSGENIVPVMTSDTSPSGIAKASNIESDTTKAFRAFDGDLTTYWSSYPYGQAQLSYEFNSKKAISKYSITNRSNNSYNPVDFTFEGSDNGTSWTVLDTQSNLTWNSGSETKTFNINNVTPYLAYRINVSKSTTSDAVIIAEFKLFELVSPATLPSWQTVSSITPTVNQFVDEGIDSLTHLIDRKVMNLEPQKMESKTGILPQDSAAKLFSNKLSLKKYIDVKKIEVK